MHLHIVNRAPANSRRARRRKNQAQQQFDRRRFPRAIRPEKSEDFAFPHLEAQAIERAPPLLAPEARRIVLRQAINFDRR